MEFQEVIKQYNRMCHNYGGYCESHVCLSKDQEPCPLWHGLRPHACIDSMKNDTDVFVSTVMAWAKEHPEPVYPTWGEWLVSKGIARIVPVGDPWPVEMPDGSMIEPDYDIVVDKGLRITAFDAQKLGLKPKGVQ